MTDICENSKIIILLLIHSVIRIQVHNFQEIIMIGYVEMRQKDFYQNYTNIVGILCIALHFFKCAYS